MNQDLFTGEFIGMFDQHGSPLHEGDEVEFYHKGQQVRCTIIYVKEWAMFCLQWPDGYVNKWPMNPEKYSKVPKS
jgi:hypothetical protein